MFFEPLPWGIKSDEDMRAILDFRLRTRLTPFAKELLSLPCMQSDASAQARGDASVADEGKAWRDTYEGVAWADTDDHIWLLE